MAPLTGDSIPLTIELRPAALAKTKRPTGLLAKTGIIVQATGRPGQLVAEVTASSLAKLENAFVNPTSQADKFAVSTIEHFAIWHPLLSDEGEVASPIVPIAAEGHKPVRLDFFPWLSPQTPLTTGQILGDYLADAGFQLIRGEGRTGLGSYYFAVTSRTDVGALTRIMGIRNAVVAPDYSPVQTASSPHQKIPVPGEAIDSLVEPPSEVTVGVLDSGIAPGILEPWVIKRFDYDLGSDRDTGHGTFVAGLIAASRQLNADNRFPEDTARLVDGQVLPQVPISENLLLDRIEEVVSDNFSGRPNVWNCSFAAGVPLDPVSYSPVAQAMDILAAKHNLLFVQAAGNYVVPPGRSWPPTGSLSDGIASPADAVRSITVGSLAHKGGCVPVGSPASYSRRGPSFGGQQKPDVVHWSGDFTTFGVLAGHGTHSVSPQDTLKEDVGTSFATPIVSAVAANIWAKIERSQGSKAATPELVKGLLVHSAALGMPDIDPLHKSYYGAGVPSSSEEILGNSPDTFTTVHDVSLSRGVDWLRTPFPVPACLLTPEGKLRAEIVMTVAYSPLIDRAFGDECVRTSIDASFGRIVPGKNGPNIEGIVPLEKEAALHGWETQRLAEGKWSPIRTYRKTYPQGHQGGNGWGLKLSLLERVEGELQHEQRVFVILTFRGLAPDLPVYQDGLTAVSQCAYPSFDLDVPTSIRVRRDT